MHLYNAVINLPSDQGPGDQVSLSGDLPPDTVSSVKANGSEWSHHFLSQEPLAFLFESERLEDTKPGPPSSGRPAHYFMFCARDSLSHHACSPLRLPLSPVQFLLGATFQKTFVVTPPTRGNSWGLEEGPPFNNETGEK